MKLPKGVTVYTPGKVYKGEVPDSLSPLVKDIPGCECKQEPKDKPAKPKDK